MALGMNREAADIAAQRLKALEKAHSDSGRWDRAQYLELIEPDSVSMLTPGEEKQADRDYKSHRDLKTAWEPKGNTEDRKGYPRWPYQAQESLDHYPPVLTPNSETLEQQDQKGGKGKKKGQGKGKGKGAKNNGWKAWY